MPVATLVHATHWKAGSQWIYQVLRALLPARIVAPEPGERQLFVDPLVEGGVYPACFVTRQQLALRMPPGQHQVFVVLRDLRDTLVSAYFSMRYSHAIEAQWMGQMRAELERLSEEDGLLLLLERWLPGCATIHASWLGSGERMVTYEQLIDPKAQALENLLVHDLALPVSPAEVRACVEANRFDRLAGGRTPGQEDVRHHQRKGVAGDWRNHFTQRITRRFDALYGSLARAYPGESGVPSGVAPGAGLAQPFTGFGRLFRRNTSPVDRGRAAPGKAGAPVAAAPPSAVGVRGAAQVPGAEELLAAYDLVSALHPNIPSYALWMAWEMAAVRRHPLAGKVLDLGCQDPRLAALALAPEAVLTGWCDEPGTAELARQMGRYDRVLDSTALASDAHHGTFDAVYARGVISFRDDLQRTLAGIRAALRPGGELLCSVLTDCFGQPSGLSACLQVAGMAQAAGNLHQRYLEHHHVRHMMTPARWEEAFALAGFRLEAVIPIVPDFSFRLFALVDELWHSPGSDGSPMGVLLAARLSALPAFRQGFRTVVQGLAEIDAQPERCAALVVRAVAA